MLVTSILKKQAQLQSAINYQRQLV